MIHIWHEDNNNSSTTLFWKFIKCYGLIPSNTEIIGYESNYNLLNAIKEKRFNSNDTYIILMDNVSDNPDVKTKYSKALKYTRNYNNVHLSKLLCFEYLMLRFNDFTTWTKRLDKENKQLLEVREALIKVIDNGYAWHSETIIKKYVINKFQIGNTQEFKRKFANISSEKICFELLADLTSLADRCFIINKTSFGDCWTCNCCKFYKFKNKCYISRYHKKSEEKASVAFQ